MRAIARSSLMALLAFACLPLSARDARAQAPAAAKAAAPSTAPAKQSADLATPVAIVNDEVITKGDLKTFLNSYQLPAGGEEQIYKDAVDSLINSRLILQFLNRQRIPVSEEKITQAIDSLTKQLAQDGTDLATEMLRNGRSMEELRKEYADRLRWIEFMNSRATDAELKKYVATHKDLCSGTQVRAAHILLRVDPKASAEDKEKLRQKLLAFKKDIETNKATFADLANKYSEDPANSEGSGGDVGYFTLNSGFIEEFANVAFALKKGVVSDPVETPYGYHLIVVTDRKEGNPIDFEQSKPFVKQMCAAELQKTVLQAERKKAKIEIKPMPAGLFPAAPAQAAPKAAEPTPKAASPK